MITEKSKTAARDVLQDAIIQCGAWRVRYGQVQRELESLVIEFPMLQEQIQRAASVLTSERRKTKAPEPHGVYAEMDRAQAIPRHLAAVPDDLQTAWDEVGGANPNLSLLEYVEDWTSIRGELFRVLQRHVGYAYRLERGGMARFLGAFK